MKCRAMLIASLTLAIAALGWGRAQQSIPAFRPAAEGYFTFDTGLLKGQVRLDGKSQAICSLVYGPSGREIAKTPGLLSYYRIFSSNTRYGKSARDWPLAARVRDGGILEVRFPPAEDHPLEMTGLFRWVAPDTLDLETVVTPQIAMPRMEVFLSSYVAAGFEALVYLQPNRFGKGQPAGFVRADWNELFDGNYLVFPRDRESLLTIFDRRWEIPPNPVTWAFTRYLAEPIALRRDCGSGLTVALMAPPEDCFAVYTPYNKQPPDNVAGHSSLYLSLFGRDVAAGETVRAHCRMIVAKDLDDRQVRERYSRYRAERNGPSGGR